jgi:dimethylaniline monooxygenase (N-oxide forming)
MKSASRLLLRRPAGSEPARLGPPAGEVAVIGAGSSGLPVVRALHEKRITVECFERSSQVGGLWRYRNDNGLSPAYESLRTNVSRARMGYPSFPMPEHYAQFPVHKDMASYLDAYASYFGLLESIHFGATVQRLEPDAEGGWQLTLQNGVARHFSSVVVATGHHWSPRQPDHMGQFGGQVSHSCEYREPKPFSGDRVLVVGSGQSAAEIAVEVATDAARVCLAVREATHVIPRWIGGEPYDVGDVSPQNRLPWRLWNALCARAVGREVGSHPPTWRQSARPLLEGIPIISSSLLSKVASGDVVVRPGLDHLEGDRAHFADGTDEPFDQIIYATGYEINLPFLRPPRCLPDRRELPLYRRIVPPADQGLFFAGFVDSPGGLLPLVEAQGDWIASVLSGELSLPPVASMMRAIERGERRSKQRFPHDGLGSLRCDPHAYRRLLRSDLRRSGRSKMRPIADDACRSRRGGVPKDVPNSAYLS